MDKYYREHKRLFSSLDHFSPYGPWPTDFSEWTHLAKALYKSSNGTTALDAITDQGSVKGSIAITPSNQWELRPKVGDMIVISRCHPSLDRITAGPVNKVGRRSFNIEWKPQWGPFADFAVKVPPEDIRCPSGHYRVDLEVENISTVRVDHALHELTTVRGAEERNVSVITPLQAMVVYDHFTADSIKNINDAEADRRRQEHGFTPRRGSSDIRYSNRGASDASGASDAHGASDASGAFDANGASDAIGATVAYGAPVANAPPGSKGSQRGDMHSEAASSSKSGKLTQQDAQETAWSDCWVRPCKYVRPDSDSDFETASRKANLNEGQRHAMTITGKHRLRSAG